MELRQRTRRLGIRLILCALILRLIGGGFPARVVSWLTQPNIAQWLVYLETGRNVRFSASGAASRWDHTAESPAPLPDQKKPVFTREDAASIGIRYLCGARPSLEELLVQPLDWKLTGEEPTVLILHTHTTESYTQTGKLYVESGSYRTLEEEHNMLCIGSEVKRILESSGITVIHDRTLHDYPDYNSAYTNSRKSIRKILEEYPSIRLVLDLHRDASGYDGSQLRTGVWVEGEYVAQLMLVMGTDGSGQRHEAWEENLSLALKLQLQLERQAPGITRPMNLRSQRFNQDLSPGALLVEVGAAGNSRQEALAAAGQLALAIVALSRGTEGSLSP